MGVPSTRSGVAWSNGCTTRYVADSVRYLREAPGFARKVREAVPWRFAAPELAWMVSRMVEVDPRHRWPDLAQLTQHLGALCGRAPTVPYQNAAMRSVQAGLLDQPSFFRAFYARLRQRSERARRLFSDDAVERQIHKLKSAVVHLLRFQPGLEHNPELDGYVRAHAAMGLRQEDFHTFVECFLEALARDEPHAGPYGDLGVAWRIVLWPGVHYMAERLEG